jgi:ATP-dependent helicase/nuclease subunit A
LTPLIIQEFLNNKYREGLSKSSISCIHGVLSCSLKMAFKKYKFLNNNPMQFVSMPKFDTTKNDKDDMKIITISDYKKILHKFPINSIFYVPLQISFNTGMRAAEVCGLTWDSVDLITGSIDINKILINKKGEWILGTPKTYSSNRKIFISKALVEILKKQKLKQSKNKLLHGKAYHISNFVCTKDNGSLVTTNSLKYLSRIVNKELGIYFNFYSLKHTHATMLLEKNTNIKAIQEHLGHNNLQTTMDTYSHITEVLSMNNVDKLEQINNALNNLPSRK